MTKKGYVLFFLIFVVVSMLLGVFVFSEPLSSLLVRSLISGLIAVGLFYLLQK